MSLPGPASIQCCCCRCCYCVEVVVCLGARWDQWWCCCCCFLLLPLLLLLLLLLVAVAAAAGATTTPLRLLLLLIIYRYSYSCSLHSLLWSDTAGSFASTTTSQLKVITRSTTTRAAATATALKRRSLQLMFTDHLTLNIPFNRAVGHWFKSSKHRCYHCKQPERSGGTSRLH